MCEAIIEDFKGLIIINEVFIYKTSQEDLL